MSATKPRRKIAVVGLPSVGKTTLIATLQSKERMSPEPTQGCNKSTLSRDEINLDLLDMGGKPEVRKFWQQLAKDAQGIIVLANAAEADDLCTC